MAFLTYHQVARGVSHPLRSSFDHAQGEALVLLRLRRIEKLQMRPGQLRLRGRQWHERSIRDVLKQVEWYFEVKSTIPLAIHRAKILE